MQTTQYVLTCDHKGCTEQRVYSSEREGRKEAREAGWFVRPLITKNESEETDLCPSHRP